MALAAELLGDPVALFLDETTSGLDPATEKEMIELFLREARSGKTVICITHFPDNVSLCDKVIVLARGQLIFYGTPTELLARFEINAISELYPKLTGESSAVQLATAQTNETWIENKSGVPGALAQTAILAARYVRPLALDARNLALLLLQAPIIALFIGATFGNIAVDYSEQHAADLKQVAFLLIMAVLWCAGTNGVREIVKERPIFLHESRYGLNEASYFISKFLPLGLLGIVQALLLLVLLGRITHFAGDWSPHFVVLSLLALAATAIGLCISAAVTTSERAMTFPPVVLIGLAVLSGGLARLQGWTKLPAYVFDPAFWTPGRPQEHPSFKLNRGLFHFSPWHVSASYPRARFSNPSGYRSVNYSNHRHSFDRHTGSASKPVSNRAINNSLSRRAHRAGRNVHVTATFYVKSLTCARVNQ